MKPESPNTASNAERTSHATCRGADLWTGRAVLLSLRLQHESCGNRSTFQSQRDQRQCNETSHMDRVTPSCHLLCDCVRFQQHFDRSQAAACLEMIEYSGYPQTIAHPDAPAKVGSSAEPCGIVVLWHAAWKRPPEKLKLRGWQNTTKLHQWGSRNPWPCRSAHIS